MSKIVKAITLLAAFLTIYSSLQLSTPTIDFFLYALVAILLLITFETETDHLHNYTKEKKSVSLLELLMLAFIGWLGLKFGGKVLRE